MDEIQARMWAFEQALGFTKESNKPITLTERVVGADYIAKWVISGNIPVEAPDGNAA